MPSHTDRRPVSDEDGDSKVEKGSCTGFTKFTSQMALGKLMWKRANHKCFDHEVYRAGKLITDKMNLQHRLQVETIHKKNPGLFLVIAVC